METLGSVCSQHPTGFKVDIGPPATGKLTTYNVKITKETQWTSFVLITISKRVNYFSIAAITPAANLL